MFIKNAAILAKNFFCQKKLRKKIFCLIVVTIFCRSILIYLNIVLSNWHNGFYNGLQNYDQVVIYESLKKFFLIILSYVIVWMADFVAKNALKINCRLSMTEMFLGNWMESKAYFGLSLSKEKPDNPDQRISEDINSFTSSTINLTLSIFEKTASVISFGVILWSLSGSIDVSLGDVKFKIHGYIFWLAIVYTVIGTSITYKIGRNLSKSEYYLEKKEANFRFSLMRIRENAESLAFSQSDQAEVNLLKNYFAEIKKAFFAKIGVEKNLGFWSNIYYNLAQFIPIFSAWPKFFAKKITLGDLMQLQSVFGVFSSSMSFFVGSFSEIASYKAATNRLSELENNIKLWNNYNINNQLEFINHNSDELIIEDLTIFRPNGEVLLENLNFKFTKGSSYLIKGDNGIGKTSLLKVINNIWPFSSGKIIINKQRKLFFLPQKTYITEGSLLEIIFYPGEVNLSKLELVKENLINLDLSYLLDKIEVRENWSEFLSIGEKQKIGILRLLISEADIVIMDESTSGMTELAEKTAYGLVRKYLPEALVISVGHRETLKNYHNEEIYLEK